MINVPAIPEGFGRAAEKLAETVRHVVDLSFSANRLRSKAQAQGDAEIILAKARAEVAEIEARTIDRLRKREIRRQLNIESITLKAARLPPPEDVSPKPVDEDWTSRFFEECQDIGDGDMQQIWARLLAGEVVRPGSFSPRTLRALKDFTSVDAVLFDRLCSFIWDIPTVGKVPVIHDPESRAATLAGLGFGALTHLTSIGLIEFTNLSSYATADEKTEIEPLYFGRKWRLVATDSRNFDMGCIMLTSVGMELTEVATAVLNSAAEEDALERWSNLGWKRHE